MLKLGTSVNRKLPCCVMVCTPDFSFGSWLTTKQGGSEQLDRVEDAPAHYRGLGLHDL